jgi:hypothetical protein
MWDSSLFCIQAVIIQNNLWNVPNFVMLLYESLQVKLHHYIKPVCQPLHHYKHFNTIFTQMKVTLIWLPQNKMSAKNIYFTLNFIHLIHKACQILSTFTSQCHCLDLHCHSTTYYHSYPLHWTLHSHFWWDVLPWSTLTKQYNINLFQPIKIHIFLHRLC